MCFSMVSWRRPSEYLDGTPCVVQAPPADEEGTVPPLGRVLPNVLVATADAADESLPQLQWLTSCYQLVALQAGLLDEGAFLWELIYPKGEDGLPAYQPGGKYAVKLWEQGAWRMIVVDDRMPFDPHGSLLVPSSTSSLELWPLILAKALYKLAEPYPLPLSQDPYAHAATPPPRRSHTARRCREHAANSLRTAASALPTALPTALPKSRMRARVRHRAPRHWPRALTRLSCGISFSPLTHSVRTRVRLAPQRGTASPHGVAARAGAHLADAACRRELANARALSAARQAVCPRPPTAA
jgi:hypothetical protein